MEKEEKRINFNNAEFKLSVVSQKQYPEDGLPEIVLVGKSNIGKSSFINALTNRKNLARTSSQPGKTRQINFYNIDNLFYLVDLPGYGYSKMSKEESINTGKFIEEYLINRQNIILIIMLVDIRHKPTEDDMHMYNYILNQNLPFIIVCNKVDKVAKTKVDIYVNKVKENLGISYSPIYPFSSLNKFKDKFIENILNEINKAIFEK